MNLKLIFYGEAFINLVTLCLCLFAPGKFIEELFGIEPHFLAEEIVKWYALVLLILSGILVMALRQPSFDFLRIVLLINVPGDLVQVALAWHSASTFGHWTSGLIFTIAICLLLFVTRIAVLLKPQLAGYKN